MDPIDLRLTNIDLSISTCSYVLRVFGLSFLVRLILTGFRCYRYTQEHDERGTCFEPCMKYCLRIILGIPVLNIHNCSEHYKNQYRGDYLVPWVLGFFELLVYPILFSAGLHTYVGAWIGLKTIAHYKHWSEDPNKFSLFLLGNALVLVFAFVCLQPYVYLTNLGKSV